MRIIGIDPGLRHTGWGVIEHESNHLRFLASGTVSPLSSDDFAERLNRLHMGLKEAIERFSPHEAAVELSFFGKDAGAALKLGHARGVSLQVLAQAGLYVAEYAPNMVKKSVVGSGHADKRQVLTMVRMLLPGATCETEHAADALAVAIAHAHRRHVPLGKAKDSGD